MILRHLFCSLFLLLCCCQPTSSKNSNKPYQLDVEQRRIQIQDGSPFLNHLQVVKLTATKDKILPREKAIVVADKDGSEWSYLNKEIKDYLEAPEQRQQIDLANTVFRSRISQEFSNDFREGQKIILHDDAMSSTKISGTILKVQKFAGTDLVEIFILSQLPTKKTVLLDYYWAELSHVNQDVFQIPSKSILYISNEEYVIQKKDNQIYIPRHVSVVKQENTSASVFGGFQAGDEIVSEGAILLKPLVEKLILSTYEGSAK